jgi:DNA polymerase V
MQKRVTKSTGIPVSIGIAPTKSLAKIANKIAKKYTQQTRSVHIINTDEVRIKALKWTKVEDVWGIGRQHAKRLYALGINNALDFAQMDKDWVQKHMSIVGLRLHQDLNGIPTFDLEEVQPKKNIATTRSFDKNFTTLDELKERVTTFAVSCAEKLRKQGSCCNSLSVFLHTNRFRNDLPQYARSMVVQLPFASNSNYELVKYANIALERIYKLGYHYKKAGVIVFDFTPEDATQLTIFGNGNPNHTAIMQTIDKLNALYGRQKIKLASQDLKRMWVMKQEKLSPRYTTNLKDIITVKC